MTRKTVVIPMHRKKKLDTNTSVGCDDLRLELEATQFAVERAIKQFAAVKRQCDALAEFTKEQDIRINLQGLEVKRLRERIERMDAE